jgi:uncharacterized membrane protein (DUF485 family)
MGGLDHGPSQAKDEQSAETSARNARYGLWLFGLYCAAYAAFVLLNAFMPDSMTQRPVAGISLSVLYGLGLIALAFILSLVYSWLCRANLVATDTGDGASESAARRRSEGSS